MEARISDIVVPLKGRDAGLMMLVVREDPSYLWLANGKGRRAEAPKRKKRKHVRFVGTCDDWTRRKLAESGRLVNSDIRKALALWAEASD